MESRPEILGKRSARSIQSGVDQDASFSEGTTMTLWLLSVIIAVVGVVQLLQGQILFAIILFIAAALVGPGGYSIFAGRRGTV
jgi:hypothetical protein